MTLPVVLDLFSGTGSATQPFVECGKHRVVRIDWDPKMNPDLRFDIGGINAAQALYNTYGMAEFVWASPPCNDFSTINQRRNIPRGIGMIRATLNCIAALLPKHWALENVAGSIHWITDEVGDPPFYERYPHYLWGNVPMGILDRSNRFPKGRYKVKGVRESGFRNIEWVRPPGGAIVAGMIPRPLAEAVHRAVCEP